MIYNGKEVLTQDTFGYGKVQIGDYVEQAVVDDAMNCLPPRWESPIPIGRTRTAGNGGPPLRLSSGLQVQISGNTAETVSAVRT